MANGRSSQAVSLGAAHKAVEAPQLQTSDKVVDVPVAVKREMPLVQMKLQTLVTRQLQLIDLDGQRSLVRKAHGCVA